MHAKNDLTHDIPLGLEPITAQYGAENKLIEKGLCAYFRYFGDAASSKTFKNIA